MMQRAAVVLVVLNMALVSCATTGPEPTRVDTHVVTSTVSVPVSTPCIAPADLPPYPERTVVDPKTATTDQLAAAAANDAEVFLAYSKAVKALLAQCTKGAK